MSSGEISVNTEVSCGALSAELAGKFNQMSVSGRTSTLHFGERLDVNSDVCLFRDLQCVVDLDPEVSNGALQFGMAEQELDGSQIPSSPVN